MNCRVQFYLDWAKQTFPQCLFLSITIPFSINKFQIYIRTILFMANKEPYWNFQSKSKTISIFFFVAVLSPKLSRSAHIIFPNGCKYLIKPIFPSYRTTVPDGRSQLAVCIPLYLSHQSKPYQITTSKFERNGISGDNKSVSGLKMLLDCVP